MLTKDMLDLLQIRPLAEELQEASLAPDDRIVSIRIASREITRLIAPAALVAARKIRAAHRVAERHIRPVVDELADHIRRRDLLARLIDEFESAARDRNPHRPDFFQCILRRQIPHACRRLCCTVHDNESLSMCMREFGKFTVQLRIELAARLRERAERREIHAEEAQPLQHRIRIRHAPEIRYTMFADNLPKCAVKKCPLRHNDGGTCREMCVEDRKPVDIVERQIRHAALILVNIQIVYDGFRIRAQILIALPHELRTARRPRRRHEKRELCVQGKRIFLQQVEQHIVLLPQDLMSTLKRRHALGRNPCISGAICRKERSKQAFIQRGVDHHRHNAVLQKTDIARNRSKRITG